MTEYTAYQFFFTTADIESMYFYGETSTPDKDIQFNLPDGVYRVIAGELFRLVNGAPYIEDNK